MEQLTINTALQISEAQKTVFDAIVDPWNMSHYFISESSGKMEAGKTIQWKFPEFEESFPVKILEISPNELITFEWDGAHGQKLKVEIKLEKMEGPSTLVKVTEGKMDADEAGIKWLEQNTAGWANFLACLKAYVEYGINLRKGAFDFMKKK
ncbi:SRPBCC domain-containing protein [Salinimicrobium gaetbulicola]|uniref:SRPBCC domain-containing protein n=1 Tax=Salinimicrobium gaetbulicola TaxID=999702 RepID=A0ABW3IGG1_9FLAO